LLRHLLTEPER